MINKRYFIGDEELIVFDGEAVSILKEVQEYEVSDDEEEVEEEKPKQKKQRKCGLCGKPGHRREVCSKKGKDLDAPINLPKLTGAIRDPDEEREEEKLADKIRDLWCETDTHFGHQKLVAEYKTRLPGYEMEILASLKSVQPGDTLIHLGDFCIGKDEYWVQEFMKAMPKGTKKILVRGNHDEKNAKYYLEKGFHAVCDAIIATCFGKKILFSHRPLPRFQGADKNIHGHWHGNDHRQYEAIDFYDPTYHQQMALEWSGYRPVELEKFINNKYANENSK